ncbi:MAG: choice-of-anchor D domain-containing protein, partial [Verrucomicrobiota bacterium]
DGTDFGDVVVAGGTNVHTFTITNSGTATLTLSNVVIGGAHAADFTAASSGGAAPNLLVDPGFENDDAAWHVDYAGQESRHDAAAVDTGSYGAWVTNNNGDHTLHQHIPSGTWNPSYGTGFVFRVRAKKTGTITGTVQMEIYHPYVGTVSNRLTDTLTDSWQTFELYYTPTAQSGQELELRFANRTGGSATGWVMYDNAYFGVTNVSSGFAPVAAGGTTTFTVTFDPTAAGSRTGTVYITNNVTGKSPYDFVIKGTGTTLPSYPEPTAISATADGNEMVRLAWTKNASYDVIIVCRATNTPTDPTQGSSYTNGDAVGSDGTRVVYKGAGSNLEHVVGNGQTHYYRFYSTSNNLYSTGTPVSVTMGSYLDNEIVDAFAYTNGLSMQTSGLNGGNGWSNAWSAWDGFNIASNDIGSRPTFTNMPLFPNRAGNRIKLNDPGAGNNKEAYRCFPAVTNGTIYLAGRMSYQNTGNKRWCGFSVIGSGTTHMVFFGKIWEDVAGSAKFGIMDYGSSQSGTNYFSSWNVFLTNTYLVVARYDFNTRLFSAHSFPGWQNVPGAEPATWFVSDTLATGYLTSVNGMGIKAGGSAGPPAVNIAECYFDELRVATNWAELCSIRVASITNYSVNTSNFVSDAQITSGVFAVGATFYDLVGVGTNADFDLLNPSGIQILTNEDTLLSCKTWYDSGRTMVATDSAHAGYYPGDLGVYTTRWSAANSNGFWLYDQTTLSNGTPMAFTVTDDDTTTPTIVSQSNLFTNASFEVGSGTDIPGWNPWEHAYAVGRAAYAGTNGVEFTTGAGAETWGNIWQGAAAAPSNTYTITFCARKDAATFNATLMYLKLEFHSAAVPGTNLIYETETNILNQLSTTWQSFTFSATSPPSTLQVRGSIGFGQVPGADPIQTAHVDNVSMAESPPPLYVKIGATNIAPVSGGWTNALFSLTDGDLAGVTNSNPLNLAFRAFDNDAEGDSGLARSNTVGSAATNMSISITAITTNNTINYNATNSSANSKMLASTNVWTFTSFSETQITNLMSVPTNVISATLRDADFDRIGDQLSVTNQQFGLLRVTDDDSDKPEQGSAPMILSVGEATNTMYYASRIDDYFETYDLKRNWKWLTEVGTKAHVDNGKLRFFVTNAYSQAAIGSIHGSYSWMQGGSWTYQFSAGNEEFSIINNPPTEGYQLRLFLVGNNAGPQPDATAEYNAPNVIMMFVTEFSGPADNWGADLWIKTNSPYQDPNGVGRRIALDSGDMKMCTNTTWGFTISGTNVTLWMTNAPRGYFSTTGNVTAAEAAYFSTQAFVFVAGKNVGTTPQVGQQATITNVRVQVSTFTSNFTYNLFDGDLDYADASNPFRINIAAYDTGNGLARGTTDPSTQMSVSVQQFVTNDVAHYSADESSSDTKSSTATNIWKWTDVPGASIGGLMQLASNEITANLLDADNDRVNDQSSNTLRYGFLRILDDDVHPPSLATGQVFNVLVGGVTQEVLSGTGTGMVFRIYDGQLANASSKTVDLVFAVWDFFSGIARGTDTANTNMNITVAGMTTNDVAHYCAAASSTDSSDWNRDGTSVWRWVTDFGYTQVGDLYADGASNRPVLAHIPDADGDRPGDQTWRSNQCFGFIRVVDDDTNAPIQVNVVSNRPLGVKAGGVWVGGTANTSNAVFTVSDAALGAAMDGANMLINGDFENGLTSWTTWDDLGITDWAKETGTNGVYFRDWDVSDSPPHSGGLYQDVSGMIAGQVYKFSIRANREINFTSDYVVAKIEFMDGSWVMLGGLTNDFFQMTMNTWTTFCVQGRAPAGSVYGRGVLMFSGGPHTGGPNLSVLMDNASFVQVTNPLTLTFGFYDPSSGVSHIDRMYPPVRTWVSLGTVFQTNMMNFVPSDSTPYPNTTLNTATSTWMFSGLSGSQIQGLIDAGSNEIVGTVIDLDVDRPGDQLARPTERYGFLSVSDDDTNPPAATYMQVNWAVPAATNVTDQQLHIGSWHLQMWMNDASGISTSWGLNFPLNFSLINPAGITSIVERGWDNIETTNYVDYTMWRNWAGAVNYTNVLTGTYAVVWSAADLENDRDADWKALTNTHNIATTSNQFLCIDDDTGDPTIPSNIVVSPSTWTNVNYFNVNFNRSLDASGIYQYRTSTNTAAPTTVTDGVALASVTATNTIVPVVSNRDFEVGYNGLGVSYYPAPTNGWLSFGSLGATCQWNSAEHQSGSNSMRHVLSEGNWGIDKGRYTLCSQYVPINNPSDQLVRVKFS